MKKLLIGLFACLCFSSCLNTPASESSDTLIVTGSTNANINSGVTTYIIRSCNSNGYLGNVIRYRTKIGTIEIGDTVVIVKK